MDWLRRFMIGRYGPDQLGVALLIVYLILIFFAPLTGLWIFRLFALAVLILCLFRMLSQHSKTLPGKPQIFSVLESNQKLVSEEKGPD